MAEIDAAGRCVTGKVTKIDTDNSEVKPGNKRKTQVPLVHITLAGASNLLPGDDVVWNGDPRVVGTIRQIDQKRALVAVLAGHVGGSRLPSVGGQTLFAALSTFGGLPPKDPETTPWTHRLAEEVAGEGDGAPDAAGDDSPDMTAAELVEAPIVGAVPAGDVPEVLL
jgi:hypothetical protein